MRLVAPGPRMAVHTPGRPLTRAYASAMIAPGALVAHRDGPHLGAVDLGIERLGRVEAEDVGDAAGAQGLVERAGAVSWSVVMQSLEDIRFDLSFMTT